MTRPAASDGAREALADLTSAMRFVLAFYEPGQRHLDTEAWKNAEAGARAAFKAAEFALSNPSQNAVTGSSGTHPVPERAADKASPAIPAGNASGAVCCYCDAPLSCAQCGMEQPDDAGHARSGVQNVEVPAGYALVPLLPTPRMVEVGCDNNPTQWNDGTPDGFAADVANDVYVSMVRAAALSLPETAKGRTIDDVPSCGQENDYRRASPSLPSADSRSES